MDVERSREKYTDIAWLLCLMTAKMTQKKIVIERQEIKGMLKIRSLQRKRLNLKMFNVQERKDKARKIFTFVLINFKVSNIITIL